MNDAEIESLLESNEDALYVSLGRSLWGQGALPPTEENLRELGDRWLRQKRQALAEAICRNQTVRGLASNQETTAQRINLVVAVCDLVTSIVSGVAPWTVSALLCKEGLQRLCRREWDHEAARRP